MSSDQQHPNEVFEMSDGYKCAINYGSSGASSMPEIFHDSSTNNEVHKLSKATERAQRHFGSTQNDYQKSLNSRTSIDNPDNATNIVDLKEVQVTVVSRTKGLSSSFLRRKKQEYEGKFARFRF